MPDIEDRKPTTRVPCTCMSLGCGLESYKDENYNQHRGKLVAKSTRSIHRKRDIDRAMPRILDPSPQVEALLTESDVVSAVTPEPEIEGARHQVGQELDTEVPDSDSASLLHALFLFACSIVAWLHLRHRLSRSAAGVVLRAMDILVVTGMSIGALMAGQSTSSSTVYRNHLTPQRPRFSLPHDLRTAMSTLSIEPNIIRSVCCPKCFMQYALQDMPQECIFKETRRSKPCGAQLWTTRNTRSGPRAVPCRLYNTQDFVSWLEFFLSRPGIEDLIDKSYGHCPTPNIMRSIWDSPAWRSLGSFTTTHGNLTFSFYIDWFNPFTNKISGKSVSCGAIMMSCLNLPYELQRLPENTFFVGIMPPPREPSVTTIIALSDPVIDQLDAMYEGRYIRTHCHPLGSLKRVAVIVTIADLLAMRKATGAAGISSNNFCSFCKLLKVNIDSFNFAPRLGYEILEAANDWKNAKTHKARHELFQKNGVRWSPFHRLIYRDPVKHTILGVMHNWFEGILQHQARFKWGIGIPTSHKAARLEHNELDEGPMTRDPPMTSDTNADLEFDMDVLDDELGVLIEESRQHQDVPEHLKRLHSNASIFADRMPTADSDLDDPDFEPITNPDYQSDADISSESEYDFEEANPNRNWKESCVFDDATLLRIRECLASAVIPSWAERPPTNLGEKSHGKLKADQWLQLFSVFLPLILPEIWSSPSQRHQLLLENFHDLVACTNIISSYSVTEESADLYHELYTQYLKSSKTLFPNISVRPNHHFALHNADMMKFWGPLILLSEFPFESKNGMLQRINTNSHLWELDFTMLRQICRRGRLDAHLHDCSLKAENPLASAYSLLLPTGHNTTSNAELLPSESVTDHRAKGQPLASEIYSLILEYVNTGTTSPPSTLFRHFAALPHPNHAIAHILPPRAISVKYLKHKTRIFTPSSIHAGNSSISYKGPDGFVAFGSINSMWEIVLQGVRRTFVLVAPRQHLFQGDQSKSPYQMLPGLQCTVVYTKHLETYTVIEADDIISHLAYYDRPKGTFGIQVPTTIVIESLYRNRD